MLSIAVILHEQLAERIIRCKSAIFSNIRYDFCDYAYTSDWSQGKSQSQSKALKMYREKYAPEVSVRTFIAGFKIEDGLVNLPLYAIE